MSSLIRWETPFRDLAALRDRMDRIFSDTPVQPWGTDEGLTASLWAPPVDVFESGDNIVLKADLPGLSQNDVEISVEGSTLTINGERKKETQTEEKGYYRMERHYGTFTRSFTLPATVDPNRIDATFTQGVLTVTLPKREESKPKQIKVTVNGDAK